MPKKRALAPRYRGPALILEHTPPTYLVQFYNGDIVRVNERKIKPVHGVPPEDFTAFIGDNLPTAMLDAMSTASLEDKKADDLDKVAYCAPLVIDWTAPATPLVDLNLPFGPPPASQAAERPDDVSSVTSSYTLRTTTHDQRPTFLVLGPPRALV